MADRRVRVVVEDLKKDVGRVVRELMVNLHGRLVGTTPVDTGWAQSNWVPQVGEAFEGTAGTRADAEAGRLDQGPANAGLLEVSRYEIDQGPVHITNNVPYIEKLNAGSSTQAPPAFVQENIVRALGDVSS